MPQNHQQSDRQVKCPTRSGANLVGVLPPGMTESAFDDFDRRNRFFAVRSRRDAKSRWVSSPDQTPTRLAGGVGVSGNFVGSRIDAGEETGRIAPKKLTKFD